MNNAYADGPLGIATATVTNTAIDLVRGLLSGPQAISRLGTGSGNFAGNPTLANFAGVVDDVVIAGSVLLPVIAGIGGAEADAEFEQCFVAGTAVQMADGTTKPIERVQAGDRVMSRNPKTGTTEPKKVLRTFTHRHPDTLALTFSDGETIETTPEHPFYVDGQGFTPAGRLALGTSIVTRAGPPVRVTGIQKKETPATVYNFEVEDDHTYFVGKANGGIWVHNDCGLEGQALLDAEPVGSALKSDINHRAATFMREEAANNGTNFALEGGDGVIRTLTQLPGEANGVPGRFEYIVDAGGNLTHQMFVKGGTINGIPIKP